MTKSQAAETIRRLAVQLHGMNEAADLLESIGSAEALKSALEAECAEQRRLADEARAERAAEQKAAAEVAEETDALVRQARTLAEKLVTDADQQAAALLKETGERIALDLESAKRDQAATLAGVDQSIADQTAKLKFLQSQEVALSARIADLDKKAQTAQQALDAIQAQAKSLAGL